MKDRASDFEKIDQRAAAIADIFRGAPDRLSWAISLRRAAGRLDDRGRARVMPKAVRDLHCGVDDFMPRTYRAHIAEG